MAFNTYYLPNVAFLVVKPLALLSKEFILLLFYAPIKNITVLLNSIEKKIRPIKYKIWIYFFLAQ